METERQQPSRASVRVSSDAHVAHVGVQELLGLREKELREIYAAMEQRLKEKELECHSVQERLRLLQEDFIYNLSLLEDRDRELERFDRITEGLTSDVNDREARIAELKMVVRERTTDIANLKSLMQAQEQQHHELLRKLQTDDEMMMKHQEDVLRTRMEEFELERADLQMQMKKLEQQLELQRTAHLAEMQQQKRSQEIVLRALKQDLARQLLEAEHDVSRATAELHAVKGAREAIEKKLEEQMDANQKIESKLQQAGWEGADAKKESAIRIAELEEQLRQSETAAAQAQTAFETRQKKLMLDSEEMKKCLEHDKTIAEERNETLTKQLAMAMDQAAMQRDEIVKAYQQLEKLVAHKEEDIRTLHNRLSMEKSKVSRHGETIAKQQDRISTLEAELDRRCHANEQLHQEMASLVASEQDLRRNLTEQKLEKERSLAALHRKDVDDQSQLVRGLIAAKEIAEAEVKLLRSKLGMAAHAHLRLRPASTPPFPSYDTGQQQEDRLSPDPTSDRDTYWQNENARLTSIIHQMRHDMEIMHQAMASNASTQQRKMSPEGFRLNDDAQQLHNQITKLQGLLAQKQTIIDQLLDQQQKLHEKLGQSLRSASAVGGGAGVQGGDRDVENQSGSEPLVDKLRAENQQLRQRLTALHGDMQRLAQERARLLDMSNALKAEVRFWTEKNGDKAHAATQTLTSSQVKTARQKPWATQNSIPRPIKQSARATPSQREAQERLATSKRANSPTLAELSPDEGEHLLRLKLRARGIRNWNERSDDDDDS
ncbi:uncharacterized protein EV422DRAFT_604303 [Fimicolochytrium jonesii]|uniref:uncharacterized protein n=1 Tax=Fimicolochytrium jonesii TaxID=1396493 RepID=UPI0022FEDAF9|nr:uncharacterized protein EV422DRAFT_604303 [Fimicolochytrium jonesii]KAI8817573.1 hypothetical protein EV422DRAFT_604303 [Fimicolochytrium jonesii]